jgi:hypothetical protein
MFYPQRHSKKNSTLLLDPAILLPLSFALAIESDTKLSYKFSLLPVLSTLAPKPLSKASAWSRRRTPGRFLMVLLLPPATEPSRHAAGRFFMRRPSTPSSAEVTHCTLFFAPFICLDCSTPPLTTSLLFGVAAYCSPVLLFFVSVFPCPWTLKKPKLLTMIMDHWTLKPNILMTFMHQIRRCVNAKSDYGNVAILPIY